MDAANIQNKQANTIAQLVTAGYDADTVIQAVDAEDFTLLKHTGLFSVQLQPPVDPTAVESQDPTNPQLEDGGPPADNPPPTNGGNSG